MWVSSGFQLVPPSAQDSEDSLHPIPFTLAQQKLQECPWPHFQGDSYCFAVTSSVVGRKPSQVHGTILVAPFWHSGIRPVASTSPNSFSSTLPGKGGGNSSDK